MRDLITDETRRVLAPFAEFQIFANGEEDITELLLNGEFDEMTLTDRWTGETIKLEISDATIKQLVIYDALDLNYERYLISDREVDTDR